MTSLFSLLGLLLAVGVRSVYAGGWAVVTLDALPMSVRVGAAVTIGFQVQQHGIHPMDFKDGEVLVVARLAEGTEALSVIAKATSQPGHYAAALVFPTEGLWQWEIRPGGFPVATMPALTVAPAATLTTAPQAVPEAWPWRQRVLFQVLAALRPPVANAAPTALLHDPVAYGKALFTAKGCVTCHVHGAVPTDFSTESGPNLTDYRVIPAYVTVWLREPKSLKPATTMPQLALSDAEVDALIAFLGAGQQ